MTCHNYTTVPHDGQKRNSLMKETLIKNRDKHAQGVRLLALTKVAPRLLIRSALFGCLFITIIYFFFGSQIGD